MARRRGRRFRGRRRFVRRNRPKRVLNGGMIRGRMHPPTNTASPWNNYVTTFLWSPSKEKDKPIVTLQAISASQIRGQVSKELGVSGKLDMRIRRIDVWSQPQIQNSTRNTIVLSPCDWTRCNGASIDWYESWGTSVQPAHVHYFWPKSISNVVINAASDCSIALLDIRDDRYSYIVKLHIVWRLSQPDPLTLVKGLVTGLRTHVHINDDPPPSDDDFENIEKFDGGLAVSPLATVVDACSLRSN